MADFDKVVPPGQEGKVNTRIDGRKLTNPGMFEKGFTVRTNDPQNQQFILNVRGTVKRTLEFSKELRLTGFAGERLKLETTITNQLATPVNITGVRWADGATKEVTDKVGIKLETIVKGKQYRLKLWSKKEIAPDSYSANLVFTTDNPKVREKTVLMAVIITKDVELQPERIIFGEIPVSGGSPTAYERMFSILAARGDSLKILKVVPNRNDMTVTLEETRPGKTYRGLVRVNPPDKLGPYLGSIVIYTNYPKYRQINLDIVGSVAPAVRKAGGQ